MNLPPRSLVLKKKVVKDQPVLALDTGFAADSIEGLRLVKASRGAGSFYRAGRLEPWVTRGVVQDEGRLLVWGDLDVPEGTTPAWPTQGNEAREFVLAFVQAWTAVPANELGTFSSSAVVPWKTAEGWAFAFLPAELRAVLDSLQPLAERLPWDHVRHPDATGAASWAFASAALAWNVLAPLPWAQEEEAHLRQEVRDLKKTLTREELPAGPEPETLRLWHNSLTLRLPDPSGAWRAWSAAGPSWNSGAGDTVPLAKRSAAAARRERRRRGAAFWRQRGTVTTVVVSALVVVAAIVGSVIWGLVKPDPTDTWTPEQVVRGYYSALSALDAETMRKLTSYDKSRQPDLTRDQDEVTNLYVIRQVRTAYEHASPVVAAQDWESQGKPALAEGTVLFGAADLTLEGGDAAWAVHYHKWISESAEGRAPTPVGADVSDRLELTKTGKGWKISGLVRQRQPLP